MDGMSGKGDKGDNVMVRLSSDVIGEIDTLWKEGNYSSRSDYIRTAVEKFKNPNTVFVEFTAKEIADIDKAIKKNSALTREDYIKEATSTFLKKDIIKEIVDDAICNVFRDPSRKDDLRDIVKELVSDELKEKFT